MANVTKDLWPDIIRMSGTSARSPVAILRQQAAYLGDKTQNIVEAEVSTSAHIRSLADPETLAIRRTPGLIIMPPYDFTHTFRLVAPLLDNYKYDLFIVMHNVVIYPLVFKYQDEDYQVGDEEEFLDRLQAVLSSEKTREIIEQLIALSEG